MKRILLATLLASTMLLAGCTSGPSQKGAEADDLEALLAKHIKAVCTFTANAQGGGLHADLDECKVTLEAGSRDDTSVTFNGHNDNLGTVKANREASISTTVYFPDGDNSQPVTVVYNAENDQVETFTATILVSTNPGFGRYEFAFGIEQFVDANKWWPGIQEKPDPHVPDPVVVTFTAAKKGLI